MPSQNFRVKNGLEVGTGVTISASGNLVVSGISTLRNTIVGGATTELIVNGNARVTGIITIGQSSVTLDGTNNQVNVGAGLTLSHSNGILLGSTRLHSTGLDINEIHVGTGVTISAGIVSATQFHGSGASLISLNASNISSGTIDTNLLGSSGTRDSTTFLRGDNSWQVVITDLVNDTSPQLGGNLDLNSRSVTGTGNINISGIITASSLIRSGGTSSQFLKADGSVDSTVYGTKRLAVTNKTTSYILASGDVGSIISITTGGVTVPQSVFSAGDTVLIYNDSASSQTITQGSGVTLRLPGTSDTGNRTLQQRGIVTVLCVASNEFLITGTGLL